MSENRGEQPTSRELDRVAEAVVSFDADGRCRECNRRARRLLAEDTATLEGRPMREVFPGEIGETVARHAETARKAEEPVAMQVESDAITGRLDGRVYASETGVSVHFEQVTETDRSTFDRPEALLATLVENSTEAIFLKDADGVYRFANQTAATVFGTEPTSMVGKTDDQLFDPAAAERIRATDERVITTGESTEYESTREIDGQRRVFQTEKHPYRDEDGVICGVLGISREITEQRERQRQLEQQEFLFERAQDIAGIGVWEYDPAEDRVQWSKGAARIHGTSEDLEPTVREAIEFYHPEDQATVEAAVEQALETGEWPAYQVRIVSTNGDVRDVDVRGEVMTDDDGTVELIRGVVQDITKQKKRERELQRKNERLDEFASVISHDLRNPLAVAKGNLTLLADSHDEEALEGVQTALERMESIIDDTLRLAQQGETVSETVPVRVGSLAERCWGMVETDDERLVVTDGATIEADPQRLQQVFENLFANAVEHGGRVVRVGVTDGTLSVADDGPGIAPDERAVVFDPGHSSTKSGTGFGLTIVKRIAEAHGWDVSVTESADGGARFEFSGVSVVE